MSKTKIDVQRIDMYANIIGHSFMLPKGIKLFVQKLVTDGEESTYCALAFHKQSVIEVQFDATSGQLKGYPSAATVALDVASFSPTPITANRPVYMSEYT